MPEREALIVQMYLAGWTIEALAKFWDRSEERVGATLKAHERATGTTVVRRPGRPRVRRED